MASEETERLQSLSTDDLKKTLGFSPEGLSPSEITQRLSQYGPNEIKEKKIHPLLTFLSYFWGPIPWMIETALILSAIVRHWPDFYIILFLLLTNAVVGFSEEHKAADAIAALKANLSVHARVKRAGSWNEIPAASLVPGDFIRIRSGDIVPADARLLEGGPLEVDQSILTGESLNVDRKSGESVFSGSVIRQGEADALVYATGRNTYFGKTAELVEEAENTSRFQKAVLRIGHYLILLTGIIVTLIIVRALIRGDPLLTVLQFSLVLTIAGIPVALPAVLSVTMAVGAGSLAKKKAIVRRLIAIEELAGVDILCADKTGTLTQNKLSLADPFCLKKNSTPEELLLYASLASKEEDKDSIDAAILQALPDKEMLKKYRVVRFTPFDPVRKCTEATVSSDAGSFTVIKGAPQVVTEWVNPSPEIRSSLDKVTGEFAEKGFRSLGIALEKEGGSREYLGILPLFDPPREDAKDLIDRAKSIGIGVKIVTGDQMAIARETAKKLGLGENILNASELKNPKSDRDLLTEKADGFAQVFPEHKFHIVEILQKQGHMVAMTGDGVNDSPALKKADCGIAVSGATDAARASASLVLTDPGLSVIIDAVTESRKIFRRMNSYALYRIAETLCILLFMTTCILFFNFYPLTAIMIVMLALLNDGAILSIAYDHVPYQLHPESWNMRLTLGISSLLGIVGFLSVLGLFYAGEKFFLSDQARLQSMMYLMLSVSGHLTIFVTRTKGAFFAPPFPAPVLWIAVSGTQILATFIAVYGFLMPPLGWKIAGFVWIYALIWFLITDLVKRAAYRFAERKKSQPLLATP